MSNPSSPCQTDPPRASPESRRARTGALPGRRAKTHRLFTIFAFQEWSAALRLLLVGLPSPAPSRS